MIKRVVGVSRGLWVVLGLLLLLFLSHSFILTGLANFLIVSDKLEIADVIVVLAGDQNGERTAEGIDLYKKGYAPKLLLSGGPLAWELVAADWMKVQATRGGVPESAIILERRSLSTKENARFSQPLLKKFGAKKIILVTSPTHTRRSKRVFERVAKCDVIARPASQSQFKVEKWWTRHEDVQQVVWEYVSLLFYLFVV